MTILKIITILLEFLENFPNQIRKNLDLNFELDLDLNIKTYFELKDNNETHYHYKKNETETESLLLYKKNEAELSDNDKNSISSKLPSTNTILIFLTGISLLGCVVIAIYASTVVAAAAASAASAGASASAASAASSVSAALAASAVAASAAASSSAAGAASSAASSASAASAALEASSAALEASAAAAGAAAASAASSSAAKVVASAAASTMEAVVNVVNLLTPKDATGVLAEVVAEAATVVADSSTSLLLAATLASAAVSAASAASDAAVEMLTPNDVAAAQPLLSAVESALLAADSDLSEADKAAKAEFEELVRNSLRLSITPDILKSVTQWRLKDKLSYQQILELTIELIEEYKLEKEGGSAVSAAAEPQSFSLGLDSLPVASVLNDVDAISSLASSSSSSFESLASFLGQSRSFSPTFSEFRSQVSASAALSAAEFAAKEELEELKRNSLYSSIIADMIAEINDWLSQRFSYKEVLELVKQRIKEYKVNEEESSAAAAEPSSSFSGLDSLPVVYNLNPSSAAKPVTYISAAAPLAQNVAHSPYLSLSTEFPELISKMIETLESARLEELLEFINSEPSILTEIRTMRSNGISYKQIINAISFAFKIDGFGEGEKKEVAAKIELSELLRYIPTNSLLFSKIESWKLKNASNIIILELLERMLNSRAISDANATSPEEVAAIRELSELLKYMPSDSILFKKIKVCKLLQLTSQQILEVLPKKK